MVPAVESRCKAQTHSLKNTRKISGRLILWSGAALDPEILSSWSSAWLGGVAVPPPICMG